MSVEPLRVRRVPRSAVIMERSFEEVSRDVLDGRIQEAHARGVNDGKAQALADSAGALAKAAQGLENVRETALADLGRETVVLALEIARHLLRTEIQEGRYDIQKIVRETLAESGVGRGPCVVHLNPRDVEALDGVPFRSGTVIEADIDVPQGDVHVDTAQGLLVHDMDAAVRAIGDRILADLESAADEVSA